MSVNAWWAGTCRVDPGRRPGRLGPGPSAGQLGRDGGAELPALVQALLVRLADDDHRRPCPSPPQPGRDRLDAADRPGRVIVAVQVRGVRPAGGRLQARIVDLVEEML